jgi:hypothetical protein
MSIQSRITGVITLLFIFGPTVVGIGLIQHGNEIAGFMLALFSLFFGAVVLFMKIIQRHTDKIVHEKNKQIADKESLIEEKNKVRQGYSKLDCWNRATYFSSVPYHEIVRLLFQYIHQC